MTYKVATPRLHEIVAYLTGSCASINTVLTPDEEPHSQDIEVQVEAEGEIRLCESCSWWCEVEELDAAGDCEDCSTHGGEEDEE